MTALGTAWDQLGVEATDDARAIRRAYARRLKTIDVDADPAAFIVLRDALAWALAQAAATPHFEPIVEGGHDTPPPPSLEPAPRPVAVEKPQPEIQFSGGDIDPANPAKLNELLFGDGDVGLARDQILKLTQTILAQAANARIDRVANIEAWLAATIANAIPRSDVMIDPVVGHFRWTEQAGGWQRSPAIDAILARQSDLRFLAEISAPDHRLRAAYLALRAPPPSSAVFIDADLRSKIQSLVSTAQRDHPNALNAFNAKTVAWWSSQAGRQRAVSRAGSRGIYWPRIAISYVLFFAVGLVVVAGLAWLGRQDLHALRTLASLPTQSAGGDDVCQWQKGPGGAQSLLCHRADGQMEPAVAPPGYGPTTLTRANAGDTAAMVTMGLFYSVGPPIAHDGQKAQAWFRRAADLGDPAGMLDLGLLTGTGTGVTGDGVNLVEAARWYKAAADKGLPQAKFMLAGLYTRGQVYPKDDSRAAALFKEAADGGWAPAKSSLGLMYEKGFGVTTNQAEAVKLYTEAVAAKDPAGDFFLAGAYLRGAGVRRSSAEAARLFQAAADAGLPDAMVNLAILYHKGDGVPASDTHAVSLFRDAAAKGQVTAMYDLGIAYRAGLGVKKNDAEAAKWFRAAADAGAPAAIKQLDQLHAARQGPTARP